MFVRACVCVCVCVSIYILESVCVCVCVCVSLSPFVLKSVFCSDLSEELRVEGCLFNVTFTSDTVTQLAVYFRAHDNDLGRQSVTLTLTQAQGSLCVCVCACAHACVGACDGSSNFGIPQMISISA